MRKCHGKRQSTHWFKINVDINFRESTSCIRNPNLFQDFIIFPPFSRYVSSTCCYWKTFCLVQFQRKPKKPIYKCRQWQWIKSAFVTVFFANPNKKNVRESIGQDILSYDVREQRPGRLRRCNNDDSGQLPVENSARTQKQVAKQLGVTQQDHLKSPTRDGNDSGRRKVGVPWNCSTIPPDHTLLPIKRHRTESRTRNRVTYGMFAWRFFVRLSRPVSVDATRFVGYAPSLDRWSTEEMAGQLDRGERHGIPSKCDWSTGW